MAFVYKTLAQLFPALATLTTLFTAPAATSAVVSSLVVANQSAVDDKVRISVAIAGAADSTVQYLYYDLIVPANNAFVATIGLTLATTDVVRAYSTNGTCSFNLFGQEVT